MTEHDPQASTQEFESPTQANKAMKGYEVNDLREEGASALSDWMTKLLMNKEFQLVPANNLQAIFARLEPANFKADQTVIQQGEPGRYFFVITSGRCAVTRELPKGRGDVKLAELSVGDTFGEEALITGATRQATVSMITDGTVMRLDKEDFKKLLSEPIVNSIGNDDAKKLVSEGGRWLNVDFAENHEQPDPADMVRIPTYLLRLKLDQLESDRQYVVLSRKRSHACAAAHILKQSGFTAFVLEEDMTATSAFLNGVA